jgi:hypothetical protein
MSGAARGLAAARHVATTALLALGAILIAGADPAGATTGVILTPGPPFTDGEAVTVSVGPNGVLTPNAKVNILECADPGGSAANLPRDDSTCDGNTIQGATVLAHGDGSISTPNYTIYQLPSATLGEQPNFQPVCNQSSPCVLYVGEDENDFTQPKIFSAPFTVSGGTAGSSPTTTPPPTAGSGGAGPGTSGTSGTSGVSGAGAGGGTTSAPSPGAGGHPTATAPSGSSTDAPTRASQSGMLAFTGAPALPWLLAGGILLVLAGMFARRLSARRDR